jgi:hypothetical protein
MKPGRVKNEFGLIGSPIYSRFHVIEYLYSVNVVSLNGATRLIQGHEFFTQAICELSVISIVPNLFFTHSRPNQDFEAAAKSVSPWSSLRRLLLLAGLGVSKL